MTTPPATRDEIDRFATEIGEWLLTQEFGAIKPLAFRHRLGWFHDDPEADGYVVIELLVTDPPPDPVTGQREGWRAVRDESANTVTIESYTSTWPDEDAKAVRAATRRKAIELGAPMGIQLSAPVLLFLRRESGGFPANE